MHGRCSAKLGADPDSFRAGDLVVVEVDQVANGRGSGPRAVAGTPAGSAAVDHGSKGAAGVVVKAVVVKALANGRGSGPRAVAGTPAGSAAVDHGSKGDASLASRVLERDIESYAQTGSRCPCQ